MNERDIFTAARQSQDAAERDAFLDEACSGDQELRRRIVALLEEQAQLGSFLEHGNPPAVTVDDSITEHPGTVIGPYKLLEQIGEGGMGTVWMAQQTEPVKRLVALKLIKAGMDSKQVIARFEAERQALALMDHANIARVLDAGTTSVGRPYFVMDLVKGVPITRYCDEHHLTPRQRLELFIPVCQAVQHAHQKGIIHRDLKPSNVLIALYDGKPVPKVIDFGVAKAAGQTLTEKTLVTGFGNLVGTLEYMSPEQAEINQLDIDTRSDIYALGVLLYELLTGSPPFTRKELEKAGMLEMLRVIREQEPSKPSTKLSTGEGLPTLAANRGTEPARLTKLVRGELDWIVMKALDKDRSRRYETANAFAADVQRHLDDEPVEACPPSTWYRFRKFVRRNKGPVVAAGLLLATLVCGIAGTSIGLARAERAWGEEARQRRAAEENGRRANEAAKAERSERERADGNVELGEEALEAIYQSLDQRLPSDPRLEEQDRELLVRLLDFYQRFATRNSDNPTVRPRTGHGFWRVGLIQEKLGQLAAAEKAFGRAIGMYKELTAEFPANTDYEKALARSYQSLGNLLLVSDRHAEARKAYGEVQSILDKLEACCRGEPEYRQALATLHSNQVRLLLQQSESRVAPLDCRKAEGHCRQALFVLEGLAKEFPEHRGFERDLASVYNMLGAVLRHANQVEQARESYDRALRLQEKWRSRFPRDTSIRAELGTTHRNLGILLRTAKQLPDAQKAYGRAIAEFEKLVADCPNVPHYHSELGEGLQGLAATMPSDNAQEARDLLKRALDHQRRAVQHCPDSPRFRRKLRSHLANVALVLAELREHGAASQAAAEMRRLAESPIDYQTVLHLHLACIGLAELDASLPAEERRALMATYGDRAVEVLGEAIKKGFFTAKDFERYPALHFLRSRADTRELLEGLEKRTQ